MSIFQMPKTSAFAINFKPVDGALLYFFEAGTTTPKTTYQEEAETTPHAHPVVADANGIFAPIFLSGSYKVILQDKNAVQIYSIDNLEANVGILTFIGSFNSSTNGGDYPTGGQQGYQYRVVEAFTLNAASGTRILYVGDYIICNKDNAAAIDADWDILRGVQGVDLNTAQTLTNKTLTNPVVTTGTFTNPTVTTGTFTNPTVTTGTFTNPTVTTGTFTNPGVTTGTFTNPGVTTGTFASPAITTPELNGVPTGSMELLIGRAASLLNTELATNTVVPLDTSIPQNTEGTEFTTLAYTPKRADSILRITITGMVFNGSGALENYFAGVWVDSEADCTFGSIVSIDNSQRSLASAIHEEISGSTTLRTYKLRAGPGSLTGWIFNPATLGGGVNRAGIIIEEFSP